MLRRRGSIGQFDLHPNVIIALLCLKEWDKRIDLLRFLLSSKSTLNVIINPLQLWFLPQELTIGCTDKIIAMHCRGVKLL